MSNPLLREDKFGVPAGLPQAPDTVSPWPPAPVTAEPTLRKAGVASATAVLLAIMLVTGVFGWNAVTTTTLAAGTAEETTVVDFPGWIFVALIAGLGLALASFFRPTWARVTAPLYAMVQGLVVGAISKAYEAQYDGIVQQAVLLTGGVFVVMLVLYATGRIRVTDRFRTGLIAATGGVMLIYLATIVLRLFGADFPFVHDSGVIGIGFSLVVVTLAALNLTLDFDFVERAEAGGAPRHMEWFAALSLVVTLVWLYLELLRLLAKLRER